MTEIFRTVRAVHAGSGATASVRLAWDPADPVAVALVFILPPAFSGPRIVTWTVSRDLLSDGMSRRCGDGDVRVERNATTVVITLAHEGQAQFRFDWLDVTEFLTAIYAQVPAGAEFADVDMDQELVSLLGGRS